MSSSQEIRNAELCFHSGGVRDEGGGEEEEEAGAIIAARISLLPFVKGKRLPRGGGVTTSLSDTQRQRRKASG